MLLDFADDSSNNFAYKLKNSELFCLIAKLFVFFKQFIILIVDIYVYFAYYISVVYEYGYLHAKTIYRAFSLAFFKSTCTEAG